MRISDWSSDVCSSDLLVGRRLLSGNAEIVVDHAIKLDAQVGAGIDGVRIGDQRLQQPRDQRVAARLASRNRPAIAPQIGKMRRDRLRSEEHTSELQPLMRISYAVFCLKKKKKITRKVTPNKKMRTADNTQKIDRT